MSGTGITITGLKPLMARLVKAEAAAVGIAARAVYEIAEEVMNEARALTPVDTGTLRSTGTVNPPELHGEDVVVEMGFGGPAAPYAIFVHEIPPPPDKSPGGRSAKHRPPTQWKYLETPVLKHARTFEAELGARMASILKI